MIIMIIALLLPVIYIFLRMLYYHFRDERIERYKRKYCIDDAIESHFGCSKDIFYGSLKK